MSDHESYKAGQDYARQNPHASKATEQQIPDYSTRTAFNNGMGNK